MAGPHWWAVIAGLLAHAVALTAFFYREFATKRDVRALEMHLREVFSRDYALMLNKIDTLHSDIKDIKEAIKDLRA